MAFISLSIYLPIRVLAVHLTLCKVDYEFLGIILWNLTPLIRPSSGQAHRKLLATPPQCSLPVTQGKRSNPAQQKTAPLPVPCVTATVSCPPSQEATPWHARLPWHRPPPSWMPRSVVLSLPARKRPAEMCVRCMEMGIKGRSAAMS